MWSNAKSIALQGQPIVPLFYKLGQDKVIIRPKLRAVLGISVTTAILGALPVDFPSEPLSGTQGILK